LGGLTPAEARREALAAPEPIIYEAAGLSF
jgi:hypothetical protein